MDKIQRVVNAVVPYTACNFHCDYCYIGQQNNFDTHIPPIQYSNEHIVRALRKERVGGPCLINLCAVGETLLAPYIPELTRLLLEEGHYITIVTNGSVRKAIEKFCILPAQLKERLFFKFSFHFLELQKTKSMEQFFENVELVKNSGISITVELTVNDKTVPHIPQVQETCQKHLGTLCHVIESRNNLDPKMDRLTKLPVEDHFAAWDTFQSPLISFQKTTWGQKRREFCYAGDWVINLYLETGNITHCLGGGNVIQNIFEDLDEPIHFAAVGQSCPWPHCYSSYFVMTCGVIPELETPCYAQMRERIDYNGNHWLSPTMREFMSSQLKESNQQYSKEKQTYISALMGFEYKQEKSISDEEIAGAIAEGLRKKNVNSLAIYGTGTYAVWLLPLLGKSRVSLAFQVDEKYGCEDKASLMTKLKRRVKYRIKRTLNGNGQPVLLNRYDHWPKVDMVVVSDYKEITKHKAEILAAHPQAHIVPITELID